MTIWIRCLMILGLTILWWWAYATINAYNSRPDRAIYWPPRPLDIYPGLIQPISAIVYTLGACALLVWPIYVGWEWPRMRPLFCSMFIGTLAGFICFLVWPLAMERPTFGGKKYGESIMRLVFSLDNPANCFPSFHAFFAINGALFIHAFRSEYDFEVGFAYALAAAVVVTTITTGQHYFIDPIGGGLLAIVSFYFSKWLNLT